MMRAMCALSVMVFSSVAIAQSNSQIVARHSGKCLTVAEAPRNGLTIMRIAAAMAITQSTCETSQLTQEWRVVPAVGGAVEVQSVAQNQCLTVPSDSAANPMLMMSQCNQSHLAEQLWELRSTSRGSMLISRLSHKCVDVEGAGIADGVRIRQVDCSERDGQLFDIRTPGAPRLQPVVVNNPQPTSTTGGIAGNWQWSNNSNVEFSDNGTVRGSTGQTGRWVHEDGQRYVINWDEGWIDRVVLSEDGQHLHGSNQNGGQVSGERLGVAANTPVATTPMIRQIAQQAPSSDCGAGTNDAGCQMNRNGVRPPEARDFINIVESLRRQLNEQLRHTQLTNLLGSRVLTAMQLGALLDVFSNELIRLDVAKERMHSVLDPEHLGIFGNKFRQSNLRMDYESAVANTLRGPSATVLREQRLLR